MDLMDLLLEGVRHGYINLMSKLLLFLSFRNSEKSKFGS